MKYIELEKQYMNYQESQLKKTSYETIKSRINKYIHNFFKKIDLPINVEYLIKFKTYLKLQKISDSYKRSLYTELACILKFGYRLYDIQSNTNKIKNFKKPLKKQLNYFTNEQYLHFRKNLKSPYYQALFDLLFYTGARRGEALALTRNDIKGNSIIINKSYTRNTIQSPKTQASIRIEEIPEQLKIELIAISKGIKNNERIFKDTSYTTIKRVLDKTCLISKLPEIRVHDFRHSHITNLLYYGFTPQGISKRVGHSNTETLFNTYAEIYNKEDKKISNKLNKELKKALK